MREKIIQTVLDSRIIAIVRGLDNRYLGPLMEAFYRGGIRLMEVTFNMKDPSSWEKTADAIHFLRSAAGERMYIGAGTVTSVDLAELACSAGAQFIVSPDTNPAVIEKTRALGMVSMPGALTPSEVMTAHNAGADFVKLFPLGCLGPGYLKALCGGPLGHIRYLAVGGVNEKNIADFVAAGACGAGVGGNLVNKAWIEAGSFDKIEALARQFIENARR